MDKEAQELIISYLTSAKGWGVSTPELLKGLGKLGYRKLPEGEPPLLNDDDINAILNAEIFIPFGEKYNRVAKAQRDSDIKFYGGG